MSTGPADALCYLGTPYTRYVGGIEAAFKDAAQLAGRLLRIGLRVYSPICHTHPIAIYGNIDPLDHEIWMNFDLAMMKACDCLLVAEMTGWQESRGMAHEIQFFERARKPIFQLEPRSLSMRLARYGVRP